MKNIIIPSPKYGFFCVIVDDDIVEFVSRYKWNVCIVRGRPYFNNSKIKTSLHRLIMGVTDSKVFVDHINGDTLNNSIGNLRISNRSQNGANRTPSKNSTSKFLGVSKHHKGWRVQVKKDKVVYKYGTYRTELEAAIVYNKWASFHHGEFANLNKV